MEMTLANCPDSWIEYDDNGNEYTMTRQELAEALGVATVPGRVLDALKNANESLTFAQLATRTGDNAASVRRTVQELKAAGRVINGTNVQAADVRGFYRWVPTFMLARS